MSIRQPLKTSERNEINQKMQEFLSRGGEVKRIGPMTVADLEHQWQYSLPSNMRMRLKRIQTRRDQREST